MSSLVNRFHVCQSLSKFYKMCQTYERKNLMVSVIIKRTIILHLLLITPQDTEWYCGKGNLNTSFIYYMPCLFVLRC